MCSREIMRTGNLVNKNEQSTKYEVEICNYDFVNSVFEFMSRI